MINRLDFMNSKDALIRIVMILQILFFIICIAAIFHQMSVRTGSSMRGQKLERYRSIRICSGETLWEISRRYYSDEYKNVHLYMKKIMQLNNMSDENINSGAYLLIPYYD